MLGYNGATKMKIKNQDENLIELSSSESEITETVKKTN